MADIYDDFAGQIKRREAARMGTALTLDEREPDAVASHAAAAKELGVQPVQLPADPSVYNDALDKKRRAAAIEIAPHLAKWLASDPDGATMAKDDLDSLGFIERFARSAMGRGGGLERDVQDTAAGRAIRRFGLNARAGLSAIPAIDSATILGDMGKTEDQILDSIAPKETRDTWEGAYLTQQRQIARDRAAVAKRYAGRDDELLASGAEDLARAGALRARAAALPKSEWADAFEKRMFAPDAPKDIGGILQQFVDDPVGAGLFIAETAGEFIPAMAAAGAVTAVTKSPMAGALVMGVSSGYVELSASGMDFLQKRGVDVSTPEAARAVLQDAELMAEAQRHGVSRAVPIAIMDTLSGGLASKVLSNSKALNMLGQSVAQASMGAGGEALAQTASGEDFDLRNVVIEGLAEFATTPIEVVGVGGSYLAERNARATRAGETKATLEQIDGAVAVSKLAKRSPEKFSAFLAGTDLDAAMIYLPAEDLQTYFQANDLSASDWMMDADVMDEAILSGGMVSVPASVYASRISGTDHAAWVHDNATMDPADMSVSEGQRFNESVRDEMQAAWDEAVAMDAEALSERASDVQVYDTVFSELRAAGRTPDVAQREAKVWSAFFATMGKRYGADPLDLMQAFDVRIAPREGAPAPRRRDTLDMSLNALRAGATDPKPRGKRLVDFVRDGGGLRDEGGDVAALDPPKGIIAETREDVQARRDQPMMGGMPAQGKGLGLDEMADAAIADGYLPEGSGPNELLDALGRDIAGEAVVPVGDEAPTPLSDLQRELSRRGIDLALSNDEIVAALEAQDGQTLFQPAPATESAAFKEWFGDSKVVDAEGKPLVVYHSTDRRFTKFDPKKVIGGQFWFTDNRDAIDAGEVGAAGRGVTMELFLSIKNPAGWAEYDKFGVDELIALGYDGMMLPDGDGTHTYVAFSPTQIKSVNNRGTFDPKDPRIMFQNDAAPRGSITMPGGGVGNGETVIRLFDGADLSTLIHESGHFFLEAFKTLATKDNAPQGMKDDLAAIYAWLGLEQGAAFTTEAQEQWARGFEAYTMEGKAPSLELADAFSRFKSWLLNIYRTVKNLNVKLTPEVREVMDRMLATDEEIGMARDAEAMRPLFREEGAAGMSKDAWAAYQRLARRSQEQAEQSLLEKTMAKVRRARESWYRAEKKEVRGEVASSMATQREYRLIMLMADQVWGLDGEAAPDIRLDRDELVAVYGDGVLAEISRSRLGGKRAIYAKGGTSLTEAAELFGFASEAEMIDVLQNTRKFKEAVDAEVERIMTERHGDPLSDGSIEEEALLAIHSEQQANTVAAEARQLAKRAGKPHVNITAKVFRQRARMMLGRMSVREAIKPTLFLAAERRARAGAEQAFARVAKGALNEKIALKSEEALAAAMRFKEQELLNHMLYLEAVTAEKEVARTREKMRDYGKKKVRAKLEGGYIEQIDALLDGYDFRIIGVKKLARRASLKEYVERMTAEGREAELSIDDRLIDDANLKHYSKMTLDEFRGLADTIANIDHMGRFKQKLIYQKEARDLTETVEAVRGQIAANLSGGPPSRGEPSRMEKAKKTGRDFLNLTINADTLLREIDGWKDLGPAWRAFKEPVNHGQYRLIERRRDLAKDMQALFNPYSSSEQAGLGRRRHVKALGGSFTKLDIISLALNTGNEVNWERVTNPKSKGSFTPQQVNDALAEVMDSRDWTLVQAIWDKVDSFWPEIEAKERRLTGTAPKKVEAKMMSSPNVSGVTLRGGYFPIKYDGRFSGVSDDMTQKELAEASMGGRFGKAQTANNHTKARAGSTGQTVKLGLSPLFNHLNDVLYDLEMGEAVAGAWRILQDSRVRDAFYEKGKHSDWESLEMWVLDTASGDRVAARGFESYIRHVRSGFVFSRLALNISTALIQPSGIAQSVVVLGEKVMLRGVMSYLRNPARWSRDAAAASPLMHERMMTFDRDMHNVMGDLETGPLTGRYEKFKRDYLVPVGFVMMKISQFYTVDMPTWVAAYEDYTRQGKPEADARTYADLMVERAQGSGLNPSVGALQRGTVSKESRQREMPRMWTALGSYMFAKFNVMYESTGKTDFKSPLSILRLMKDVVLAFTLEAVLYNLVKGGLPDDDDEWPEFLLAQTGLGMLGTLPGLREASSAMAGFGGGGVIGSAIEGVTRPAAQIAQGEMDKAAVKAGVNAAGILFHLPASQTNLFIDAMLDERLEPRDGMLPIDLIRRPKD